MTLQSHSERQETKARCYDTNDQIQKVERYIGNLSETVMGVLLNDPKTL